MMSDREAEAPREGAVVEAQAPELVVPALAPKQPRQAWGSYGSTGEKLAKTIIKIGKF